MNDADTAFKAAEEKIERARAEGATGLDFNAEPFRALDRLPSSIAALTQLDLLSLGNTKVADLTPLQGLSTLQVLHLGNTQITDLALLQGLSALQALYLGNTQVTDLTPLQGLTALQTLFLASTQVTDLAPLKGLSALQDLHLANTQVADLTPLQGLPALKRLSLANTQVAEFTPLQGLTALETLNLANTQVTDLTPLQGLSALHTLMLNTTQVTDLAPLQGLSALQRLHLGNTQVTDLRPLQGLSALQELDLNTTQVTDLRPIADLTDLGEGRFGRLSFKGTPAARATSELTRLSRIKDDKQRTRETLAYLRTLPPLPAPLPWEERGIGAGGGTPPVAQAAQAQIAFLLDHAATSQASAATTADQIRHALRDVPASDGNKLPPVLQTMLDVAQVLDRLSRAPIGPDNPDREAELTARIAELEALVQALTAQLRDADAAREAAEALARAQGFLPNLTRAAGTSIGEQAGRLLHTGILSGTVYFLGTNHALHHALLRALEALK